MGNAGIGCLTIFLVIATILGIFLSCNHVPSPPNEHIKIEHIPNPKKNEPTGEKPQEEDSKKAQTPDQQKAPPPKQEQIQTTPQMRENAWKFMKKLIDDELVNPNAVKWEPLGEWHMKVLRGSEICDLNIFFDAKDNKNRILRAFVYCQVEYKNGEWHKNQLTFQQEYIEKKHSLFNSDTYRIIENSNRKFIAEAQERDEECDEQEEDTTSAWSYMTLIIERNYLKCPRSAKFEFAGHRKVVRIRHNTFAVKSYVDSQNSFGAMVRTHFYCEIKYKKGKWSMLKFEPEL